MGGGGGTGGIFNPIPLSPSIVKTPDHPRCVRSPVYPRESPSARDPRIGGKGGDRTSPFTFGGVLQSPIRGAEGFGGVETDHRSLPTEQVRPQIEVQNGDSGDRVALHSSQRLVFDLRFERRILADSHPSWESQVPPVLLPEPRLSVQSTMFRSLHGPTSFHTGDGSGFCLFTPEISQNRSIPGRLAGHGRLPRGVDSGKGRGFRYLQKPRNCHQHRKVGSGTTTDDVVSWHGDQCHQFQGFSFFEEKNTLSLARRRIHVLQRASRSILEGSLGTHGVPYPPYSCCQTQDESSPVVSPQAMELRRRERDRVSQRRSEKRSDLVVGRRSSRSRKISQPPVPRSVHVDGCVGPGLGGHIGQQLRLGSLEAGRNAALHQCQGASCCGEGAIGSSDISEWSHGRTDVRQHDSSGLSEMSGGLGLSPPQYHLAEDPQVLRARGYFARSPVSSGFQQCGGRFSLQTGLGSRSRVDTAQGGVSRAAASVVCECGSFRYLTESPVLSLFCASPRPTSYRSRRDGTQLGQPGLLCFSSLWDDPGCPKKAANFIKLSHDSDRTNVETETLVSRSSRLVSRGTNTSTSETRSPSSATRKEIPQKSPSARPSCVATIRRFAKHVGIPSRVADKISKSRRSSTRRNYQAKWDCYRAWCSSKGHSTSRPNIAKISLFLLWLWEKKGLSLPTIKAYRSMLAAVFRFKMPDIGTNLVLKELIRSFTLDRPRTPSSPAPWDLSKVLGYLSGAPFEPLDKASLLDVTKKTLFLLALATAKRVGELQALSYKISKQGNDIWVSYLSGFVAKTESAANPLPRTFRVRSLHDFAGNLEEGRTLCPVRAIRVLREKTREIVNRPSSMFVAPSNPSRAISKNAISHLLRKVIKDAGAVGHPEGPNPRAHSIRGMATSVAFEKNVSVANILRAATWRSQSVFSSFYLKDISFQGEEFLSLGPFVAADNVIH